MINIDNILDLMNNMEKRLDYFNKFPTKDNKLKKLIQNQIYYLTGYQNYYKDILNLVKS